MRLGWIGLVATVGCQGMALDKDAEDDVEITAGPTFYQDVLPIVGENCQSCHNTAEPMGGAFPLETYDHVAPLADTLLAKMRPEGDLTDDPFFMPPFYARDTAECATVLPWRGDFQASGPEVEIFEAWIIAGKQEGDPDLPTDFTPRVVAEIEGDDLIDLSYKGEYEVPAPTDDITDTFRCFAVEFPETRTITLTEDMWVDAFEFIPGNTKLVHHMLAYVVPNLGAHIASGLAEDGSSNSWTCAGGVSRNDGTFDIPVDSLLYGWVPGSQPLVLEEDMAMRLEAGTGLVLQIHYNTLGVGSADDRTDLSTLRIRPAETPSREARIRLFGVSGGWDSERVEDPPFLVPAGARDHVESYAEVMPDSVDDIDLRIWGVVPHMHLAGTSLRFSRVQTSGDEDCLAHVPRWDFNWQQFYQYDGAFEDLPRLRGGETLRLSCTLDNTDDNVFLDRYLGGAVEAGIELGESTSEEMCLIALGMACEGLCPDDI